MASTNKTTNYELSQFLGTDKPAWLSDYNTDMSKIDAGMKGISDTATGADGKADANTTAIGTLANLTTDAKTNLVAAINEVDTAAGAANTLASDAYATATAANDKATGVQNSFTFTRFGTSTFNISGGNFISGGNTLSTATNTSGSVGKMYGRLVFDATSTTATLTANVPFSPSSNINVDGFVLVQDDTSNILSVVPVTFNANGSVSITLETVSGRRYRVIAISCIIFFTDFGD